MIPQLPWLRLADGELVACVSSRVADAVWIINAHKTAFGVDAALGVAAIVFSLGTLIIVDTALGTAVGGQVVAVLRIAIAVEAGFADTIVTAFTFVI